MPFSVILSEAKDLIGNEILRPEPALTLSTFASLSVNSAKGNVASIRLFFNNMLQWDTRSLNKFINQSTG